ncbi:MAG TPA: hypothetical protein VF698_16525 [Thermoanaerobaculia bacterium]|jgi:hypothetical protein
MQHLTEEQLVEHYYHDDPSPAVAEQHLRDCAECRAQYAELRKILALVTNVEPADRGETYGGEVWSRLRWKLGRDRRRRNWQTILAAAAVLILVFLAGRYHRMQEEPAVPQVASAATRGVQDVAPSNTNTPTPAAQQERLLLLVVGDHLDTSERMLLEVANADLDKGLDAGTVLRAEELVASNRIYRQSAARGGDARVASILSDIEPILLELKNAGDNGLTKEQLAQLQKRIESKGLLFKVRVMSAQVEDGQPSVDRPINQHRTNSL